MDVPAAGGQQSGQFYAEASAPEATEATSGYMDVSAHGDDDHEDV